MSTLNSKFNLLSYSAFTMVYIGIHTISDGQAVYTDIDPDIVLSSDLDHFEVDMDNNGSKDFVFTNFSYTTYSTGIEFSVLKQILWAGPYSNSADAIAGKMIGSGFFPYALTPGSFVGDSLPFQNWWNQRLAFMSVLTFLGAGWHGGYWFAEQIDHYLGIKFRDGSGKMHFGWIRCDVIDSGRTLILKDYAYETKLNKPIKAGDMIGDTTTVGISVSNELQPVVYCFNSVIHVLLPPQNESLTIQIYDSVGKSIYTGSSSNYHTEIYLDLPHGIYFIDLTSIKNHYSQEIYFR